MSIVRGLIRSVQRQKGAHEHQESLQPTGVHSQSVRHSGRLELRDLSVDLDTFRLRGVTLDVRAGEYVVVLGPTGAGKTVLLEAVAGLFSPHRGRILIDGQDVTDAPPEKRGIGFVYQDYALFPHLDVAENIAFGLKLQSALRAPSFQARLPGLPARVVRRLAPGRADSPDDDLNIGPDGSIDHRVAQISELLSADHLLDRRPDTLSGGEQQRVALARALVVEPRLLLLDEPLSALDPETKESLQRELARVHRDLGTTTLHVTHDFEEAVALADRIAVVQGGRIVQVGSPEAIFRRPANEFVARFVGVRNVLAGAVEEGSLDGFRLFTHDGIQLAVVTELNGPAHASIRPEDIIVSLEPLRSSARNAFQGEIVEVADRGTLIYLTVQVGGDAASDRQLTNDRDPPTSLTCVITHRSLEEMGLRERKEVHLAFKASAVHVF